MISRLSFLIAVFLSIAPAFAVLGAAAAALDAETASQDPPQQRGFGRGIEGVYKARIEPHWLTGNSRFWYRNDLRGGAKEFILVDAEAGTRERAFDHDKLAASLSEAAEREFDADELPFDEIEFIEDGAAVRFVAADAQWSCNLQSYECTREGDAPAASPERGRGGRGFGQRGRGGRGGRGFAGRGRSGQGGRGGASADVASPGGKWTASIQNGNVVVRSEDGDDEIQLSQDGTEEIGYGLLEWSPDSKSLVAFRIEPGEDKEFHRVESSPEGGGRAVLHSRPYPLPGDKFTAYELTLFDVENQKQTKPDVERIDFGRPNIRWMPDGRHFAYQKNDRGHQRLRVIQVDAQTGEAKNIVDEQTDTFIWTAHAEQVDLDPVTWLDETEEIIYASERDGWRHLYLVDAKEGHIKHQITQGEYVVRGIELIDEEKRQIWFRASGRHADQDPYFIHSYRVNFDGTGLVALTEGNGTHSVEFSPDRKYLIDTYSRVDMPPVHELRRSADGQLVCRLEVADVSELEERGGKYPEVFVAKGRDGQTDIWGLICRPRDFDPGKKYPIIEAIYAGPHGAHVPKSFVGVDRHSSLTDLGFIVVQIDGMGTAHRSKAFHDVCWQNIKDAGFPDRILWMQAAAAKYPHMDTERVGIYGTSAGGQNAAGAVLFHPEFYKAAVANCGCHDNRMDKASWNEQWMGYPVGPQYSASSNIDNAHRLEGALMLILGEMDDNVPPESTLRFVDALIEADKDFDFLFVPGGGHGAGAARAYHTRRMHEFFVRHLIDGERPSHASPVIETVAQNQPAERINGAQEDAQADGGEEDGETGILDLASLTPQQDRIANIAGRYRADLENLTRFYFVDESPNTRDRLRRFYMDWLAAIVALPEDTLSESEREDLDNLKDEILRSFGELEVAARTEAEIAPLAPFAATILQLADDRVHVKKIDPLDAARRVSEVSRQVEAMLASLQGRSTSADVHSVGVDPAHRQRAAQLVENLTEHLQSWYGFYNGYDPAFTWWLRAPYEEADEKLKEYVVALRQAPDESEEESEAASPDPEASTESAAPPRLLEQDVPDLAALMQAEKTRMQVILEKYQSETGRGRGRRGGGRGRLGRGRGQAIAARQGRSDERSTNEDAQGNDDDRQSERPQDDRSRADDDDSGEETTEDRADRARQQREAQRERALRTSTNWLEALSELEFEALNRSEQVDYLLLQNHIDYQLRRLERSDTEDDRERPEPVDESGIRGRPIGREALLADLAHEMIAYSPQQLIKIAEREYAWCQAEIKAASREMGFGDDWRAAVEKVKSMHVAPGEQPQLIQKLAIEAIDYLKEHDLVTVPPIAAETWRMQMMTPERQLINPFFTGGNTISVSFPTDTMPHEAKLQSMRGNNIPFARATVQHELIPGHNLQAYMNARYATHRRPFNTPFWTEGWALYWEMLLYSRGFARTPEDRVGFLVWRQHRCARIVFSLGYHLGQMKPQECIDYLVANVGFERNNAEAEVRRSFETSYAPLYQAAYMLGGLQFRALHEELVDSGKMTDREFHDAILKEGNIPVVMVRALLTDEPLSRDGPPEWLFYGPVEE